MKILLFILILTNTIYSQEKNLGIPRSVEIIDNHIGGNFQIDYIHKAGYKNPLYKFEFETAKRFGRFTTILNIGKFIKYEKTAYESKHYGSAKLSERINFDNYYLGGSIEYTKAKVQIDQDIFRGAIIGGYKVDDLLEIVSEYQFPDNSIYKLSSVHFGFIYYQPLSEKLFIQIKEIPFLFFTNRDNLGRVGNDFTIGIFYKL